MGQYIGWLFVLMPHLVRPSGNSRYQHKWHLWYTPLPVATAAGNQEIGWHNRNPVGTANSPFGESEARFITEPL